MSRRRKQKVSRPFGFEAKLWHRKVPWLWLRFQKSILRVNQSTKARRHHDPKHDESSPASEASEKRAGAPEGSLTSDVSGHHCCFEY